MKNINPNWRTWLRAVSKDPHSQIPPLPSLAILTGQDARALAAVATCWDLYASSDDNGRAGALAAVRMLLPAMQRKCWPFARALIARSLDWSDIDRLWLIVSDERVRDSYEPT